MNINIIKQALTNTIESIRMVERHMPNGTAKDSMLGYFIGVEKQCRDALEEVNRCQKESK
jgi:hypothetical protein